MPVTATAPEALAAADVRTILARNTAVQTWLGAANETAALALIFIGLRGKDLGAFILITEDPDRRGEDQRIGLGTWYRPVELLVIASKRMPTDGRENENDAWTILRNEQYALRTALRAIQGAEVTGDLTSRRYQVAKLRDGDAGFVERADARTDVQTVDEKPAPFGALQMDFYLTLGAED